jgi:hypothetical protein
MNRTKRSKTEGFKINSRFSEKSGVKKFFPSYHRELKELDVAPESPIAFLRFESNPFAPMSELL